MPNVTRGPVQKLASVSDIADYIRKNGIFNYKALTERLKTTDESQCETVGEITDLLKWDNSNKNELKRLQDELLIGNLDNIATIVLSLKHRGHSEDLGFLINEGNRFASEWIKVKYSTYEDSISSPSFPAQRLSEFVRIGLETYSANSLKPEGSEAEQARLYLEQLGRHALRSAADAAAKHAEEARQAELQRDMQKINKFIVDLREGILSILTEGEIKRTDLILIVQQKMNIRVEEAANLVNYVIDREWAFKESKRGSIFVTLQRSEDTNNGADSSKNDGRKNELTDIRIETAMKILVYLTDMRHISQGETFSGLNRELGNPLSSEREFNRILRILQSKGYLQISSKGNYGRARKGTIARISTQKLKNTINESPKVIETALRDGKGYHELSLE